eukprot:PLAT4898.1.p2 GENE.PLAT4898.1~~PLAT4898.1.p2  ORF type:complete len:115 (-),score=43.95 PLAT4898.1:41-385(-)
MGHTALTWATCKGHKSVVELLLAAGADTTHITNRGETAEQCAIRNKYPDIAAIIRAAAAAAGEEEGKEEGKKEAPDSATAGEDEAAPSAAAVKEDKKDGVADGVEREAADDVAS